MGRGLHKRWPSYACARRCRRHRHRRLAARGCWYGLRRHRCWWANRPEGTVDPFSAPLFFFARQDSQLNQHHHARQTGRDGWYNQGEYGRDPAIRFAPGCSVLLRPNTSPPNLRLGERAFRAFRAWISVLSTNSHARWTTDPPSRRQCGWH